MRLHRVTTSQRLLLQLEAVSLLHLSFRCPHVSIGQLNESHAQGKIERQRLLALQDLRDVLLAVSESCCHLPLAGLCNHPAKGQHHIAFCVFPHDRNCNRTVVSVSSEKLTRRTPLAHQDPTRQPSESTTLSRARSRRPGRRCCVRLRACTAAL